MTHAVKVLYRTHLPGAGSQQDTGTAQTGKQMVVGSINVSAYTTSGEVIRPNELGLHTVDYISFDSREQTTAYHYFWQHTTFKLRTWTFAATPAELSGTTDLGELSFVAVGDSVANAELT